MKYIKDFRDGDRMRDIYLCKYKLSTVTKNGKPYESLILLDKTGTIDAKIWDLYNDGIDDFDAMDVVEVHGDVIDYHGALQVNVKRIRKCSEDEYDLAELLPCSDKDTEDMMKELKTIISSVENSYCSQLLKKFFIEDEAFVKAFCFSSAAKTVHHNFIGGLLEHTLGVTKLCDFYCTQYPMLNRDLLLTAAMFHDIGKTKEISPFPENDYTDCGNLLGHIVMGSEMVSEKAKEIEGFPEVLLNEIKHCILAHHGELEYGSPKKPALMEAAALTLADNTDAKMESFTEVFKGSNEKGWLGFNRVFESNIRATQGK